MVWPKCWVRYALLARGIDENLLLESMIIRFRSNEAAISLFINNNNYQPSEVGRIFFIKIKNDNVLNLVWFEKHKL